MATGEQEFNPQAIEPARQELWERDNVHRVIENPDEEKYFIVDMFPYPSGTGIHVGHVKNYVATDVQARMLKRQGLNVLHPMGYDSFGLPAENYALANGIHPKVAVERNVLRFGQQLRRLGLGYDWDRQINTTDDEFVHWTQDGFLTLFEKGLVSEQEEPINWCGSCETGLSNEDLEEDGCCERCGSEVERKLMRQWSVHITEYADQLLEGMDELQDWEPFLLDIQRDWIGKQEGWTTRATIHSEEQQLPVDIFIRDPSVLVGATHVALSPEEAKKLNIVDLIEDSEERARAQTYIEHNLYKRDKDRTGLSNVELSSLHVTNPFTGEVLPVFIAEAILPTRDNGMVFGNPQHSQRDSLFAIQAGILAADYVAQTPSLLKAEDIVRLVETQTITPKNIYRLEDWVFSRQRFWGEPIPLVHCADCGVVPVPRDQLPILLPDIDHYESTHTGESPLAAIEEWVNTCCPGCDGPAKRETNTMPQWAGSSWYWHRYKDPHNTEQMVGPEADKYWGQVDMYVGGAEHAARHLIYARFWNFVMHEAGVVVDKEPFKRVQHIGLVMDESGVKISKRLGNGVNLDEVMDTYGVDALRLGVMQMGEFSKQTNWNNKEILSARKFLNKVWRLQYRVTDSESSPTDEELLNANTVIQKVSEDVMNFKFNTAIAAIRTFATQLDRKQDVITKTEFNILLSLLQPFAPHITEQIMVNRDADSTYMMKQKWPTLFEVKNDLEDTREVVVMRNGKKLGVFVVSNTVENRADLITFVRDQSEVIDTLFAQDRVKRVISPKGKNVLNLVVSD